MLKCARELFSIEKDIHYLNNAYMAPNLKSVEMAGIVGVKSKSRPYLVAPEDFFEPVEHLRNTFARVINAHGGSQVAVIPSASYGLANVAANVVIGKKRNIVLPYEQFPSNYYVWESLTRKHNLELRVISPPSGSDGRGKRWNEAILDAIDADTLLCACPHIHWADGTLFDLEAFRLACSSVDAYLVVDGSQSVGALPFDVAKVKPDALVVVGYKWLYGPYGIGFAYYGERLMNGSPVEENWANRYGSHNFKDLVNYQDHYREGATRYNVGESSNFITVPMMQTALDQILGWGVRELQDYSKGLLADYLTAFRNMGCAIEADEDRSSHLVGVRLPDGADATRIADEMKKKKVYVSVRGDSIRLAISIHNSRRDMDAFLSVLHHAEMV